MSRSAWRGSATRSPISGASAGTASARRSTDDFEAKFSLTPLIYGTLKGTFYALLIAVPMALLGAVYVSEFMHPAIKAYVDYYLAEGTISTALETVPYVNLPADQLAASRTAWDAAK